MKWTAPIAYLACVGLLVGCSDDVAPAAPAADSPDATFEEPPAQGPLSVEITAPASGTVFSNQVPVVVAATIQDGSADGADTTPGFSVSWTSDQDGPLMDEQGTGDTVEAELWGLSAGVHILTVAIDDGTGRTAEDSVAVSINRAPIGELTIAIDPDAPRTSDVLEASVMVDSEDPEGDPLDHVYTWKVNGQTADEISGPTLPSVLTTRGDTWTVEVQATDGISLGPMGTASVEILNTAPALAEAKLFPSAGGTNTSFTCEGVGWDDPDGDPPDVTYIWHIDELVVANETTPELASVHTQKGDSVSCTVTPHDGIEPGEPVTSQAVPVLDTAPSLDVALLDPTTGTVETTFSCSGEGLEDPDHGDVPYVDTVWVVNGETLPGTSSTTFSAAGLSKGDTVLCRLIPVTVDAAGAPVDSVEVTLSNAPPVCGSVVMEPAAPTELTGVTCVPATPLDPDGDSVGFLYIWTVDGQVVEGEQGVTLSGEHYDKGSVVSCTAIPFDEDEEGEPVAAKFSLEIQNSPPALETVTVTPAEGSKQDTFTCLPEGWVDPDPADVPSYDYAWALNGDEIPGAFLETLSPAGLPPGEITCTVTPSDGADEGLPVTSAPALLINHPPSITGVTLGPEPATEATTLVCTPEGWEDQDGDPEGYLFSWTLFASVGAGQEIEGASEPTLTSEHFNKGHLVVCAVTPTDGDSEGASHTSNPVQITNSPPALSAVTLDPATGGKATEFNCTPEGFSDLDPGDPQLTVFAWTVNGEVVPGAIEGAFVPGDDVPHGAQVRCQATPFDGEAYGEPVESGSATITNSPPIISGVFITPNPPTADDTLTCGAMLILDADGDAVELETLWVRNGVPLQEFTDSELPAAQTSEGDEMECQLTPFDGELQGQPQWSDVVIVGAAAEVEAPVVTISPSEPANGDTLTCEVDGVAGTVTWSWSVGGVVQPELTGSQVTPDMTEPCEVWTCAAFITTDTGASSPTDEDQVQIAAGSGSVGEPGIWYGHHGFEPGDLPAGVNQWAENEEAATLVSVDDEAFPLSLTHMRFLAHFGKSFELRIYEVDGILPGALLASKTAMGTGQLEIVELPETVTFDTPEDFFLSIRVLSGSILQPSSLYGDGLPEATTNLAKSVTCVDLDISCLLGGGTPTWGLLTDLGHPFTGMGNIILDAGSASGEPEADSCP